MRLTFSYTRSHNHMQRMALQVDAVLRPTRQQSETTQNGQTMSKINQEIGANTSLEALCYISDLSYHRAAFSP
jgi:hypothetical protein